MTTEQHLEAARRAGQIARSNHWRAVSDHPFDNDQEECSDSAVLWVAIAAHHAFAAQECAICRGVGWNPTCSECRGKGWTTRAT